MIIFIWVINQQKSYEYIFEFEGQESLCFECSDTLKIYLSALTKDKKNLQPL